MNASYKRYHGGHAYTGSDEGRGGRENSKIWKAIKGVASCSLLDDVAREDNRRRNQQRKTANEVQDLNPASRLRFKTSTQPAD